jgi:hypothetical protein
MADVSLQQTNCRMLSLKGDEVVLEVKLQETQLQILSYNFVFRKKKVTMKLCPQGTQNGSHSQVALL